MMDSCRPMPYGPSERRRSRQVVVRSGGRRVLIGGGAPVVVQSMTNTDTADAIRTAIQVKALAQAGKRAAPFRSARFRALRDRRNIRLLRWCAVLRKGAAACQYEGERQTRPAAVHCLLCALRACRSSHSCAAGKRLRPGTEPTRLMVFQLGSKPGACSRSMRPNR